jgi:hypothetical protein
LLCRQKLEKDAGPQGTSTESGRTDEQAVHEPPGTFQFGTEWDLSSRETKLALLRNLDGGIVGDVERTENSQCCAHESQIGSVGYIGHQKFPAVIRDPTTNRVDLVATIPRYSA